MSHVVTVQPAPYRSLDGTFEVHIVPAAQDNLSFLLVCKATGETAAIDGPDPEVVLAYARQHGLTITSVLNTHTHFDHIGINRGLRDGLGEIAVVGPQAVAADVPGLTRGVDEGDEVRVGALRGAVLRTDGHIFGHIAFLFGEALFCGDTLFTGGSGRVFSGDFVAMQRSLAKLRALPDTTRVFCAHEYTLDNLKFALSLEPRNPALRMRAEQTEIVRARGETVVPGTLAEERATNPMLRWDAADLLAGLERANTQKPLTNAAEIYRATRELKDSGSYRRT